jgi:hypothetical protein
MKKAFFLSTILLFNLSFAKKHINYCKNFYEQNQNFIINNLFFESSNNNTNINYKDLKDIKKYLTKYPYDKEKIIQYIDLLNQKVSNLREKSYSKRYFRKKRKECIKNARSIFFNVILLNDKDIIKKYINLYKTYKKELSYNIMPIIFMEYFRDKLKTDKLLFNPKDIQYYNFIMKNKNKEYYKEIRDNWLYILYLGNILNEPLIQDLFMDNDYFKKYLKKVNYHTIRGIRRICYSEKRFKKYILETKQEKEGNIKKDKNVFSPYYICKLFNLYKYFNDEIYYYFYTESNIKNHLWIYLDSMYKLKHNQKLERAYKQFLILLKVEPNVKYLSKLVLKSSYLISKEWMKHPNNFYKTWFYISRTLEILKPYKDYLLKNKETKENLLNLLEIYEKSSSLLKSYWLNQNLADNVVKIHNKTEEYLKYFGALK